MIAFFGAGLLGSGFVRAMLRRGEPVNVWNRTAAKARALETHGAKAFDTPDAAAAGARRVHLSLTDDAAVDDVLERARPSLREGMLVVDHSTTSVTGTRERIERWNARGVAFVHAPVFMGPQHALESTGIMLVSGERGRVTEARPHLERMAQKVLDVGDRPDGAAAFKLLGSVWLTFVSTGLAEFFTMARALSIEPRAAASLLQTYNPGARIDLRVERLLRPGGPTRGVSFKLATARKDVGLALDEALAGDAPLAVLPAVAARMDALMADGHAADDWSVLARDAVYPTSAS